MSKSQYSLKASAPCTHCSGLMSLIAPGLHSELSSDIILNEYFSFPSLFLHDYLFFDPGVR